MQKKIIRTIVKWNTLGNMSAIILSVCFLLPVMAHAREFSDDLFSVCFSDEKAGWACGRWGAVVHTEDGGKTWHRQDSGTDYSLSSICFIDRKKGWAVGNNGTIVHTQDGGMTWKKQESPVKYFLMDVCFVNAEKGWIATERTHILFTKDGGKTWTVQFSDVDFILKSISFSDELNGWAVGEYGYTYHTANGGKTWEHQAGEYGFSDETGEIIGGNFLFDIVVIDPNTAWVSGIDGYVARTIDTGITWQRVTQGVPQAHLFGITLDGAGNVIVGGTATLIAGSVRDNSFREICVQPSIQYGWIYGVAPRAGIGFAAVGSEGWIYVSDSPGPAGVCQKVLGR
jgi:photosystem II stability/assembly factor-like uncharacterized protein